MKRIVIVGSQGQLGSHLAKELKDQHELILLSHADLAVENLERVMAQLKECRPDIVINASAYNEVDACESNPDLAFKVNAIGPRNLAIACNELEAGLVHVSTDYVFDGKQAPSGGYTEFDPVAPLNVYGRSKLAGEIFVRDHAQRFYIVRTSWLYGALDHPASGKNFVLKLIDFSFKKDSLQVVDDQVGSPTYAADLALKIAEIIQTQKYGIYHVTNAGQTTWFKFAEEFLSMVGSRVKILPCTSEQYPSIVDRPHFSVLSNYMLKLNGFKPMPDWKNAVSRYINTLRADGYL
jgi:dTDP-4-dehydrorhamnose reductase